MDAHNQYTLSILIVSWNVKRFLRDCLNSIYDKTQGTHFEIIVIDNASSDGSADMVRQDFPQVHLIESEINLGFGKANNRGLRVAKGKYIGLLNPDTVLNNDAFGLMIKQLENDPEVGLVGPKLVSVDGIVQKNCARHFNSYWGWVKLLLLGHDSNISYSNYLKESAYSIDQPVECVSGACMVFKRDILKNQLIFDPKFFMYGEDIDLCYTAISDGWKIFYLSRALVTHYGGESSKQEENVSIYDMEAVYLLALKRYGTLAGWLLRILSIAASMAKLAVSEVALLLPSHHQSAKWSNRKQVYLRLVRFALKIT